MTLVIVKRIKNQVSFSSDSRICFGNQGCIDHGIKIFSVPVKISTATSVETGHFTVDYNHKLGLAVIGNAINAYTVKDSVYEMVQHLQYAPTHVSLSLDLIADLVFKVYKKTTLELGSIIQGQGMCKIILGGYCPQKKDIRIFKFDCDTSTYPIVPNYVEILTADGIEAYGSGAREANLIIQAGESRPLHIVREVIRNGKVATVGGGLQYGEFVSDEFKIFGVTGYELDSNGYLDKYTYSLRGIYLYEGDFKQDLNNLHISYPFLRAFEDEL